MTRQKCFNCSTRCELNTFFVFDCLLQAGSAYSYTYIASGEFLAFLIGWSVILEYVLSVASVARGWSATIDAMFQSRISNGTMAVFGK